MDNETLTLVQALGRIARTMGVFVTDQHELDFPRGSDRALAPATRSRFRVMNHIPRDRLTTELARNMTPLENLARFVGYLASAITGPNIFRPMGIGPVVCELAAIFSATRPSDHTHAAGPARFGNSKKCVKKKVTMKRLARKNRKQ